MDSEFAAKINSPVMYLICGTVILSVVIICIIFMVKAWREGVRVGIDKSKMKKTIVASASFTALPSISILLGVISLAGVLGFPIPWMRLSVVGALQYEGPAAEMAVQGMGFSGLSAEIMNGQVFVNCVIVMTVGIIWGALFCLLFLKRYQKKVVSKVGKNDSRWGTVMFNAMFVGMVCAFIGTAFADLRGYRDKSPTFLSLIAALMAAAFMGVFTLIIKKTKAKWLESFSLSLSMLLGMGSAVVARQLGIQ